MAEQKTFVDYLPWPISIAVKAARDTKKRVEKGSSFEEGFKEEVPNTGGIVKPPAPKERYYR